MMKHQTFSMAAVILLLTGCSGAATAEVSADELQDQLDQLQADYATLEAEKAQIEEDKEALETQMDEVRTAVQEVRTQASEIESASNNLRSEVDSFQFMDWQTVVYSVDSATDDVEAAHKGLDTSLSTLETAASE